MSANTDLVEQIQTKMASELMPAIRNAEMASVDLSGETIDIPQQIKAKLKQKVNAVVVEIRTALNQISI